MQSLETESRAKIPAWEGVDRDGGLEGSLMGQKVIGGGGGGIMGNKVEDEHATGLLGKGESNGQVGGGRVAVEVERVCFAVTRAKGSGVVAAPRPRGGASYGHSSIVHNTKSWCDSESLKPPTLTTMKPLPKAQEWLHTSLSQHAAA